MSWGRNFIAGVKAIVAMTEAEVKKLVDYGENAVNTEAAKLENGFCKALGEAFEAVGKKVSADGSAITELGVHIESAGHFNPDGSGKMTLTVTSAVNPVAPPAPDPVAPPAPDPVQTDLGTAGNSGV